MPLAKPFSKQDILRAMARTKSVRAAARFLGCSYQHLKPYMKMYRVDDNDINSPTLFETHKNQVGLGIPKFLPNKRKEPNVKNILENGEGWASFEPDKIKVRAIEEGYLEEVCAHCGFCERRVIDYKMPLLLHFKDGDKTNYLGTNLELLCYNCYHNYIGDFLNKRQIRSIESNQEVIVKDFEWQLDSDQIENMKALGIWEEN